MKKMTSRRSQERLPPWIEIQGLRRSRMARLWALLLVLATPVVNGDISRLNVYPNPVRSYLGDTELVFDNITDGRLKIYNAEGSLVRDVSFDSVAFYRWDLTNDDGNTVASGVYYFELKSEGETKTGKFSIIR